MTENGVCCAVIGNFIRCLCYRSFRAVSSAKLLYNSAFAYFNHFYPSLIFTNKAGAYSRLTHKEVPSVGRLQISVANNRLGLK